MLEALADGPRTRHELFLGSMERERLLLNGARLGSTAGSRQAGRRPEPAGRRARRARRHRCEHRAAHAGLGSLDRVEPAWASHRRLSSTHRQPRRRERYGGGVGALVQFVLLFNHICPNKYVNVQ